MRGKLGVAIDDGTTYRIITKYVEDLEFTKTAPGGHNNANMRIRLPRDQFPNLGPADHIYIFDACTGRTLWDGYTDNPGPVDGSSGQGFDLSALGGMVLASDRSERLIYLDRTYDGCRRDDVTAAGTAASATCEVGQFPDTAGTRAGQQGLFLQFPPGQPIGNGSRAAMVCDYFDGSPMTFGGIAWFRDNGVTDANYVVRINPHPAPQTPRILDTTASTSGSSGEKYASTALATNDFDADKVGFTWVFNRTTSSTNVTTDDVWSCLGDIAILGQLVDRNGVDLNMASVNHVTATVTGGIPDPVTGYILASEVAEDLLGRILLGCDPMSAVIDVTTAQINQLVYLDGATPAQVFEDLELQEPDFYWGIGETLANGLHRFWFKAWPVIPRYEISTRDQYRSPGGDFELCNRIIVYWTDSKGVKQATPRGAYVPELGDRNPILAGAVDPAFVGRIKDAEPITLPDGLGSVDNAERIGDELLATRAAPPKSATAVIDRPLKNSETGLVEQPWEMEPGGLVRVRETGDVLRLTETRVSEPDSAVTFTLGEPQFSDDQRIARLERLTRRQGLLR